MDEFELKEKNQKSVLGLNARPVKLMTPHGVVVVFKREN
jgi:hypothetical protein